MASERQWQIAEKKANKYREKISQYFTESVQTSGKRYVEVEVLIPLTEDINQIFKFMAPYEYMDEDNTALKKYFNEHICPIEEVTIEDMEIDESAEEDYEDGVFYSGDERFLEMATVKWGFDSIKLAVYGSEGPIPHFHFYKGIAPEKSIPPNTKGGGCICIEEAKYFVHSSHKATLNNKEAEHLIDFLRMQNKTFPELTNWQYILGLWNDSNSDQKQVSLDLKIPDYTGNMESIKESGKRKNKRS